MLSTTEYFYPNVNVGHRDKYSSSVCDIVHTEVPQGRGTGRKSLGGATGLFLVLGN